MALYRELDQISSDKQLEEYRKRIIDRFGKIPQQGEELLRIMPLKRLACKLGMERIILKNNTMICFLVEDFYSPYYQSTAFDKIIKYANNTPRKCQFIEAAKRSIRIDYVQTIKEALDILTTMWNE